MRRRIMLASCLALAALLAPPALAFEVTDATGDALPSGQPLPDPDLLRAMVDSDGREVRFYVEFLSGTFDAATAKAIFAIDVDQCPSTGGDGIAAGGLDAGLIGPEYMLEIGETTSGLAAVLKPFPYTSSTRWPVTVTTGTGDSGAPVGYLVTLPAGALGADEGAATFKVMATRYLGGGGSTGVLDYLPDAGVAPGVTEPIRPSITVWDDGEANYSPDVAYDPVHDEYLAVWQNNRGASTDIYARRIDGDGAVLSWFSVVAAAGESHSAPAVAFDPVGQRYLVTWTGPAGVLARTVSSDGSQLGPIFGMDAAANAAASPDVAYGSAAGEFLVVFEGSWSGLPGIGAQRVRASDGALLGWATVASGPTASDARHGPAVAYDPVGNRYLVAYASYNSATPAGVWARAKLVAADLAGASAGAELDLGSSRSMANPSLGLAAAPDEFLVVWAAKDSGTLQVHTYGQRVSGAGVVQGGPGGFQISAQQRRDLDVTQSATYSPGLDSYLVAWERYGCAYDVQARLVHTGADVPRGPERVVDNRTGTQWMTAVACSAGHRCLLVESALDGDYDVAGRLLELALHADGFEDATGCGWSASVPALQGACPAPGTVALWHLDEGWGQTAHDSGPLEQHLTLGPTAAEEAADPGWIGGSFRDALSFASSVPEYVAGAAAATFPASELTLEVWVRPTGGSGGIGGDGTVFLAEPYVCMLVVDAVNNIVTGATGNGTSWLGGGATWWTPPPDLDDGAWHYLAITFDGVADTLYVDGQAMGTGFTSPTPVLSAPAVYTLGSGPDGDLDGAIDDLRLSRIALTPEEIAATWARAQAGR